MKTIYSIVIGLLFFITASIAQPSMYCNLSSYLGAPYCANPSTGQYVVWLAATANPSMCGGFFSTTLQRKASTSSTWGTVLPDVQQFPTSASNAFDYFGVAKISQVEGTTYNYRVIFTFNPSVPIGSPLFCNTIPNAAPCTTSVVTISTIVPARVNFKINGNTVNTSTAVQACDGGAIEMNNISCVGLNSTYSYRFGSSKNGSAIVWDAWTNLTGAYPPSLINIKPKLVANHGAALTGNYNIYMEVSNTCGVTQYWGKLQVISGTLSLSLKACTDINCFDHGTIVNPNTTCSSPLSTFCNLNTILSASSSNITLLSGNWSCKLEELPYSCLGLPVLVFNKPSTSLSNIEALTTINLNQYATIYGGKLFPYITSNSATKIWKFTLTVSNICGTSSFICYLKNINTGCKTDGSSTNSTDINDLELNDLESLKDGWDFYPNPANKEITVLYNVETETPQSIKIYDMAGKLQDIKIKEISISESSIDISSLSKGVYIIERSADKTTTKKLIVE